MLDAGYGTASRVLDCLGSPHAAGLDAIVVTHRHPDHAADLHAIFRWRWLGERDLPRIQLLAPAGVMELLAAMESDQAAAPHRFSEVFDIQELPASSAIPVGPFRLDTWLLPHWVPNAGIRLAAENGPVVAYTGDTGPSPALAEFGRDADLFVVEASDARQRTSTPDGEPQRPEFHLDGREAGRAAAAAGCRRLVLTHFWPGNDRARTATDAAGGYSGEIVVADEGLSLTVP